MILLGKEIEHVGQNAMFVFWRQVYGKYEGSWSPWSILFGYEMDDWVVFWCTMLFPEPKEKLFNLLLKVV